MLAHESRWGFTSHFCGNIEITNIQATTSLGLSFLLQVIISFYPSASSAPDIFRSFCLIFSSIPSPFFSLACRHFRLIVSAAIQTFLLHPFSMPISQFIKKEAEFALLLPPFHSHLCQASAVSWRMKWYFPSVPSSPVTHMETSCGRRKVHTCRSQWHILSHGLC